jgi:hypothetical protein
VFAPRIRLAHEQKFFVRAVARHEHQHRVGLCETGQVIEIAVLPVFVVDIARVNPRRGAEHDQHRLGRHLLQQSCPSSLQILLQIVGGDRCRAEQTGHQQGDYAGHR